MDGSKGLDFDQSAELEANGWQTYFHQLITQSKPQADSGFRSRVKVLPDPAKLYSLDEFILLVMLFFKAVRVYLISQNKASVIVHFENQVYLAQQDLEKNLLSQPASIRCQYAVNVLAKALRGVDLNWIKSHPLFHGRLHIDDLVGGLRRLENLGVIHSETPSSAPVLPAVPNVRAASPIAARTSVAYKSVSAPAPVNSEGRSFPYARYAVGAILAVTPFGYSIAKQEPPALLATESTQSSFPSTRERRQPNAIEHDAELFRHTIDIVDPVKPHTSVVVPTLTEAFSRYPTQLSRCYAVDNPLHVHSANELAHYIADHPHRAAHNLVQQVSRRRRDRVITIWWSEDCHEIVIAPGVQTTFSTYIRPNPVTILFTPPAR